LSICSVLEFEKTKTMLAMEKLYSWEELVLYKREFTPSFVLINCVVYLITAERTSNCAVKAHYNWQGSGVRTIPPRPWFKRL